MATKYAGQNSLNKLMSLIKNAMPKASTGTPLMDGTAAVGTSNAFARGDHVHPSDTAKVSKSGDTMTGPLEMGEHTICFGTKDNWVYHSENPGGGLRGGLLFGSDDEIVAHFGYGELSFIAGAENEGRVGGLRAPENDNDAANKAYVDGKVSGLQNAEQVQAAISAQLGSVYKPMGSCTFDGLPTTAQVQPGCVYNITDAFTTTDAFAEGSGHAYPAGTNIVWIKDQNGVEMWDVLAGTIDLEELTSDDVQAIWNSV